MGILDIFRRDRKTQQRPGSVSSGGSWSLWGGGNTVADTSPVAASEAGSFLLGDGGASAGQVVTEETALSVPAFLAGVRLISQALALAEIDIYNGHPDLGQRENSHPAYACLNSIANRWTPSFTVRTALNAKRLIHGNAFAEIDFSSDGTIKLWPLMQPDFQVTPWFDEGGALFYRVSGFGGQVDLPPERILHLRGFSTNGLTGISLLQYAREALGLSRAQDQHVGKIFKNSARPGGYIKVPEVLGEEAFQRMKKEWENRHLGSANAHRISILEQGASWMDCGFNNDEMQLIESRQLSVEDFARVLGIPLAKLRVKGANAFMNVEEDNIDFVANSLMPLMICDEQEISFKLLQAPYSAKYDTERLLTVNTATRDASFANLRRIGVYNIDDIRRRLKMPPLPNGAGKVHLQEVNLAPVEPPSKPTPESNPVSGPVAPVAPGAETVQDTALNGAQISSLMNIVIQAASGVLPVSSAKALASSAFPALSQMDLDKIFADIKPGSVPPAPPSTPT